MAELFIPQFHRSWKSVPYELDFAELTADAIQFVATRVCEYWSQKNPSGGVDLSGMPGEEFGFRPMEVLILRKLPKKAKEGPTRLGVSAVELPVWNVAMSMQDNYLGLFEYAAMNLRSAPNGKFAYKELLRDLATLCAKLKLSAEFEEYAALFAELRAKAA